MPQGFTGSMQVLSTHSACLQVDNPTCSEVYAREPQWRAVRHPILLTVPGAHQRSIMTTAAAAVTRAARDSPSQAALCLQVGSLIWVHL